LNNTEGSTDAHAPLLPASVAIVANKIWEADPLVAVLASARARAPGLQWSPSSGTTGLRGYVEAGLHLAEIWCVEELMDPKANASSSQEKARVLPPILSRPNIKTVVAFGTASTVDVEPFNGCVVVGTNVFVHDPKPPGSTSAWQDSRFDQIVGSTLSPKAFAVTANPDFRLQVQARLLTPTLNPAKARVLFASYKYVALSDVNIIDYDDYTWADPETVSAFRSREKRLSIGSLETTHGVIRLCSATSQFMFVSGIADRIGYFNYEVAPSSYNQNFVAAHNAAIAVAQILPALF
jgi:hypothetical protein